MNPGHNLGSLPVELSRAILEEASTISAVECSQQFSQAQYIWQESAAILNLSHICRDIRCIALKTPALWAAIHLFMPQDAIEAYLARSKDAPLSIYIPNPTVHGSPKSMQNDNVFIPALDIFMNLIATTARRWELIAFDIPSWTSGDRFLKYAGALDLSALKHVSLHMSGNYDLRDLEEDDALPPLDWKVPSLVTLDLLDIWPAHRTISGPHVESIRLRKYLFSGTYTIANRTFASSLIPSLKTLRFFSDRPDDSLRLKYFDNPEELVTFPVLEVLEMSLLDKTNNHRHDFQDYRVFNLCRFPKLRDLDIYIPESQEAHLVPALLQALSSMPALEELRLNSQQAVILEQLLDKAIFPVLGTVLLHSTEFLTRTEGDISSMVQEWRIRWPPRLQSVTFNYCKLARIIPSPLLALLSAISSFDGDQHGRNLVDVAITDCDKLEREDLELWRSQLGMELSNVKVQGSWPTKARLRDMAEDLKRVAASRSDSEL